jgi:hypothetical protein
MHPEVARFEAGMGIDPRERSLLALVAMQLRRGRRAQDVLASVEFTDERIRQIVRGLAGDETVSLSARVAAFHIARWADRARTRDA